MMGDHNKIGGSVVNPRFGGLLHGKLEAWVQGLQMGLYVDDVGWRQVPVRTVDIRAKLPREGGSVAVSI